jgi:hypothetical protein
VLHFLDNSPGCTWIKVKVIPEQAMKQYGEVEIQLHSFLTSIINEGEGKQKITKKYNGVKQSEV